jgi:hypothetical protein
MPSLEAPKVHDQRRLNHAAGEVKRRNEPNPKTGSGYFCEARSIDGIQSREGRVRIPTVARKLETDSGVRIGLPVFEATV